MAQRMSKRLQKEYEAIQKNTHEMKVLLPNNDLSFWHVNLPGAKGTLYEGENFTLQLRFTNEYVDVSLSSPSSPPKLFSSDTSQSMNISIRMASSASPFCTMVLV
jgi:ubiquitin-protein ligase